MAGFEREVALEGRPPIRELAESGPERMAEAILYVASRGSQIPDLGVTKIYRTLVVADILAQASLGQTVTRWRYVRLENGPVPDEAEQWMASTVDVTTINVPIGYGRTLKRVVPHREPRWTMFSDEERNLLDMAMGMVCNGADDASECGQALPAWRWSTPHKAIEGELLGFPYLIASVPAVGAELDAAMRSLAEQGLA